MRSQVIRSIKDPGRWAGTIYLFKSDVKVAIVSLYQVGKKVHSGLHIVYSQQREWVRKHGQSEDPRAAMIIDLKEEIKELQK